jgi:predicted RNA-binding Zn ribbon-like protein
MAAGLQANEFKLVGGSPSLDFVNTVGGWGGNPLKKGPRDYRDAVLSEKLDGYADLVAWSRHVRLLTDREAKKLLRLAKQKPQAAAAVLERGLLLRRAIYRLFKSVVENWQPDAADGERLSEELSVARSHEKLIYAEHKFSWGWDARDDALDRMLWPLALSAAGLLTSGDLSRIRQCGGDNCGWLFLDTSRNRSRQWCAMNDCGNLAKVRRFRQRQREGS